MITLLASLSQTLLVGFAGIAGIGLLIIVHELGHFLFCKLFRVSTPTFSIGLGPKLFSKKIGSTEFTLSALPFGGYVEIGGLAEIGQGEQKDAASTKQTDRYAFAHKPYYQKMLILLGGIIFNILFAFVTFWVIFWSGAPKSPIFSPQNATTTVSMVAEKSPAHKAGLKAGDTILSINTTPLNNDAYKIGSIMEPLAHKNVILLIERGGATHTINFVAGERLRLGKKTGSLDIAFQLKELPGESFFDAYKSSIVFTWHWIKNTAQAYANLFLSRDTSQMSGPLSLFEQSIKSVAQGAAIFWALLALISINLAILNLIPLPIFDGGQLVIQTIEALIRRNIPLRIKEYIFIVSWLFIILLTIFFSAKDIMRMAGSHINTALTWLGLK